jgi:glycosyltransferase involved in cell wall biosynthesis
MNFLDKHKPLVSVVIPTFNSARFLENCLISLEKQSCGMPEVIVVDEGSTDSTVEIAARHRCKIVKNPKVGRAAAKNEGARLSSGSYLLFIDSDMELSPGVVEECLKIVIYNPNVGGVVIPEKSLGGNFWVKVRNFERSFYAGSIVESARFFPERLVKASWFDEDLVFYEEATLPFKIKRMGYDVSARIKSVIFHHEEDFSLSSWMKKKYFYGKTLKVYEKRYFEYSKSQSGVYQRVGLFLKNWRKLISKPQLALGIALLKSLEYFAVSLGRFSSF